MQRPFSRLLAALALLAVGAATPITATAAGTGPSFKGPIGLQLYSLRADFIRNPPATLPKVRDYGFKLVELAGTYNIPADKFNALLAENGLKAVSGHFPFERYRDDIEAVAKEAKALQLEYAGCAWIPHQGDFDEAECREAIRVFNAAGQRLAKDGIKFFYHIHGYEFHRHGDGTLFDLLVKETRPESVAFQMDVFWAVHPGQDPVRLLERHGARWQLMHIKDMRKGVATGVLTGKSDVTNDVVVGTGQMNWPAILKTAAKVGVKYYFIEDESPTAAEQIPQSLKYLEQVRW